MKDETFKIGCIRQCQSLMGLLQGDEEFTPREVEDISDTVANIKQLSSSYMMSNLEELKPF